MYGQAILKLLEALAICGIDSERISVKKDEREHAREGEAIITYKMSENATVTIYVADFWRYPGVASYFVNARHTNGAFSCGEGTPHLMRAVMDFGSAVNFIGGI